MMFLDCPAYLDQDGAERCGLPAEVRCRFTMHSTDGPVESAMIRCPAGHYFCGDIESLTWDSKDTHDPGSAAVTSRARRDSVQGSHDSRDGTDGSAARHFPAEPDPEISRPNTAPAYYLGRPARLWTTAMHPRRRRTTSRHPMKAVTSGGKQTPSGHDGLPGVGAETACLTSAATSLRPGSQRNAGRADSPVIQIRASANRRAMRQPHTDHRLGAARMAT